MESLTVLCKGSVVDEAFEFAEFIVKGPSISNKYVKYLVNHVGELHKETAFMQENMIQTMLLQTQDHGEGIAAFFEKEKHSLLGSRISRDINSLIRRNIQSVKRP